MRLDEMESGMKARLIDYIQSVEDEPIYDVIGYAFESYYINNYIALEDLQNIHVYIEVFGKIKDYIRETGCSDFLDSPQHVMNIYLCETAKDLISNLNNDKYDLGNRKLDKEMVDYFVRLLGGEVDDSEEA